MGEIISQDVSGRLKRSLGHYTDLTSLTSQLAESTTKLSGFVSLLQYDNLKVSIAEGYDWKPAFDAAFSSGKQKVIVPDGEFLTTNTLTLPVGVSLELSDKARIKAIRTMTRVLETPLNTSHEYGFIRGGVIDCNDLADIGIHIRNGKQFTIRDTIVEEANVAFYKLGDNTAPASSYECFMQNCNANRPNGSIAKVGSTGILLENASDNQILNSVVVGAEVGVQVSGGDNHFVLVHVWNRPSNGAMKKGFVVNASKNYFTNCIADTPSIYGFELNANNNVFSSCHIYNGVYGSIDASHPNGKWDNTLVAVQQNTGFDYNTFIGTIFAGGSDTRIANDFNTAVNSSIIGSQWQNVTASSGNRIPYLDSPGRFRSDTFEATNTIKAPKGVLLDGANGSVQRAIYIKTAGFDKWRIGSDGGTGTSDAGLSFVAYPEAGGSIQAIWINRNTAEMFLNQAAVNFAGTYDKPLILGSNRLWFDSLGKLRTKSSTPTNDTDGTVVGTQA